MDLFKLDCDDIIDVFKNNLRIDNDVKSISHTFFNERYISKIDFKPYYQRNYVWDDDKATYFIESILLGTEIPPIVIFDSGSKKEVIDGRQRFETIYRFINGNLTLSSKGLKSLTHLENKIFKELPEELIASFKNTKIRILEFKVTNEPELSDRQKEKIKKEIFRRYNSGITPLKTPEIDRAEFLNDPVAKDFTDLLSENSDIYKLSISLFISARKQNQKKRDMINLLLSRIRVLITLPYIPIYSYASAKSKSDAIKRFYYNYFRSENSEIITKYRIILEKLQEIQNKFIELKFELRNSILIYEVLYWMLSHLYDDNTKIIKQFDIDHFVEVICNSKDNKYLWKGIQDEPTLDEVFAQTGSHYYKPTIHRYLLISNYFSSIHNINVELSFKNSAMYKVTMDKPIEMEQYYDNKLSKTDPSSASIFDILKDVEDNKFLIRPDYQRSETINVKKASYLLESILLDIKIPPIFIFKRKDMVSEVVDGQQRLLSIIGFLGELYRDETNKMVKSNLHKFKLSKLSILKELTGCNIDKLNEINPDLKDQILDFPIDIIEIDQNNNPNFSQIDLFLRLNSKPYPISANGYEMWNAYIDKNLVDKIKEISKDYSKVVFKENDKRMKNEELIVTLSYLDYRYRMDNVKPSDLIKIYVKNKRINARMNSKANITNLFDNLMKSDTSEFLKSIENVELFISKLKNICNDDFAKIPELFAHPVAQAKTNQNFYLLWIMLNEISLESIQNHKKLIFNNIQEQFKVFQKIPDKLTVNEFIANIESII